MGEPFCHNAKELVQYEYPQGRVPRGWNIVNTEEEYIPHGGDVVLSQGDAEAVIEGMRGGGRGGDRKGIPGAHRSR